jgi:hypothetical protein
MADRIRDIGEKFARPFTDRISGLLHPRSPKILDGSSVLFVSDICMVVALIDSALAGYTVVTRTLVRSIHGVR